MSKESMALARIVEWTRIHGAALRPRGADTYREGMRDAKEQVAAIIAACLQPADGMCHCTYEVGSGGPLCTCGRGTP